MSPPLNTRLASTRSSVSAVPKSATITGAPHSKHAAQILANRSAPMVAGRGYWILTPSCSRCVTNSEACPVIAFNCACQTVLKRGTTLQIAARVEQPRLVKRCNKAAMVLGVAVPVGMDKTRRIRLVWCGSDNATTVLVLPISIAIN